MFDTIAVLAYGFEPKKTMSIITINTRQQNPANTIPQTFILPKFHLCFKIQASMGRPVIQTRKTK